MNKILITPRSLTKAGHPALKRLNEAGFGLVFCSPGQSPGVQELTGLIPGCAGWLAGVETIPSAVFDAADCLRVISRNGTGIDNIDLAAAQAHNVAICRAEGANARGVAELAIALIMSLARSIPFHDAALKREVWDRRIGVEIRGRTLGVIGCGKIGREAARLAILLGMKVLGYDIAADPAFIPPTDFMYADLDRLLSESDVITLHCAAQAGNRPLIDRNAIGKMKTGVYIINTARASLLNEHDVLEGLVSGKIAGVAADVHMKEPPDDYSLVKHDRVIALPHLGGYSHESVARATEEAVDNLLRVLR
ncbi:MAG: phosphoglycerate dehydrogenase [Candidatus Sumerlaeota bacterium]|nr:phosphoglycerate dehydrogenase [Candidatus Sumerlaeota bacterium]